jgi:hypothetical protein
MQYSHWVLRQIHLVKKRFGMKGILPAQVCILQAMLLNNQRLQFLCVAQFWQWDDRGDGRPSSIISQDRIGLNAPDLSAAKIFILDQEVVDRSLGCGGRMRRIQWVKKICNPQCIYLLQRWWIGDGRMQRMQSSSRATPRRSFMKWRNTESTSGTYVTSYDHIKL